jgi:hypothetical protein
VGRVLGGWWVPTTSGMSWSVATLRRQCQSMPGPLAVLGEVVEAVAAQTTSWQPANRYLVRVGKTVEASVAKLRGYLSGLQRLLCVMGRVSGCGRRSRLLPREDLSPPIGVGGGDPSASSKALAGRDRPSTSRRGRPCTSCGLGRLRFPRLLLGPCWPASASPWPQDWV